ncbi:hypothetical protein M3Y98_00666800 [Aphelenchoides besseyi]|nr:hypothetical protein M3Y98_00666800 [Aphelenchoides besseyi]KAI6208847.1 hypothetical protein M3Y96_00158500 [Aphelenchoides besseyi]
MVVSVAISHGFRSAVMRSHLLVHRIPELLRQALKSVGWIIPAIRIAHPDPIINFHQPPYDSEPSSWIPNLWNLSCWFTYQSPNVSSSYALFNSLVIGIFGWLLPFSGMIINLTFQMTAPQNQYCQMCKRRIIGGVCGLFPLMIVALSFGGQFWRFFDSKSGVSFCNIIGYSGLLIAFVSLITDFLSPRHRILFSMYRM